MIAPGPEGLADEVRAVFRTDGPLARACKGEGLRYEPRPQQAAMALAVAEAMEAGTHLAVEAGTGVGKSLAYLIPALLAAKRSGSRVVVSTFTISLQEQLIHKDIPLACRILNEPLKAALVVGRGNYLCLRRLARVEGKGGQLMLPELEEKAVPTIRAWSRATRTGLRQDLPSPPPAGVWESVCAEHGNCLFQACPEYRECHYIASRRQAEEARVLVVNHSLFFSDLALREQGGQVLPDYGTVIFDEAHQIEAVASDHLGLRLSEYAMQMWLRRLAHPEGDRGLLASLRDGPGCDLVRQAADLVFEHVQETRAWTDWSQGPDVREADDRVPHPGRLLAGLQRLIVHLGGVAEGVEDEEMAAELASLRRRGEGIRDGLRAWADRSLGDSVYWVAQEGIRRKQLCWHAAPIEVGPMLRARLFEAGPGVIMTSATLGNGRDLEYFRRKVGAGEAEERVLGSPFDYGRQMRIRIAERFPEPTEGPRYEAAVAEAVVREALRHQGATFVLFTSAATLRAVVARCRPRLEAEGITLLAQDGSRDRHRMLQAFRDDRRSVLFGLDSFWMGVDVRGDALTCVIITRLPFAVPDQPLIKARMARIKEQGGEPFRSFSLPEAVLKFRQGVGRLIRTAEDRGDVVVLDSRITRRNYGRVFLRALPDCPVEAVDFLAGVE